MSRVAVYLTPEQVKHLHRLAHTAVMADRENTTARIVLGKMSDAWTDLEEQGVDMRNVA